MSRLQTSIPSKAPTGPWLDRVDAADWSGIRADLDRTGCALTTPLLDAAETAEIAALYTDDALPSTVDMGAIGSARGVPILRRAVPGRGRRAQAGALPRLLPIARDWWTRLGREAPWPDTLAEWLEPCHAAGQTKSTPIVLRYRRRRLERAAPRPLRRARLPAPGRDQPQPARGRPHRRRVPALRAATARAVARHRDADPPRTRARLHDARPPGGVGAGMVGSSGAPRGLGDPLR